MKESGNNKQETLFVTGGAGFVGSNFIRHWLSKYPNSYIINYDLLTYAGNLDNLLDVVQMYPDRYVFIKGNICNYEYVLHLLQKYKPDYVVHFAAESHNSNSIINPTKFYETNVLGTQVLLHAAHIAKIPHFHYVSTCEVYGDLPLDSNKKFTEKSPYKPRTPYNATKASAELAVRAYYYSFGLPITISICPNNYGPYQFPEKVIPYFTILALQGKQLPLYQSSHYKREWLHVYDHCCGIEVVLKQGTVGETYNIGTGFEITVESITDQILGLLGLDQSFKTYVPDRPGLDRRYLLDSSKIYKELNWQPEISPAQGFQQTVTWYKENKSWWLPLLSRLQINESKW